MNHAHAVLTADERAIVAEEQQLLERARTSIGRQAEKASRAREEERKRQGDLRSVDSLRALREEASRASADDLPPLLLELEVRQRLLARHDDVPLPDVEAPYFAHLRVREGKASKDYLLGRTSLLDTPAGVRIVDWRVAPVARIFYRYREGDDYEESFPGRDVEGVVEARRIVVVEHGAIVRIVGDDLVLSRNGDGQWTRADRRDVALASGGAGTAVRPSAHADITALLDREQFAAISAPADQALVVLGSAGSGKTTVALHRLARLAADDPAGHPLDRALVVVPEEGLARLSRRLLEPLGASDAQVQTVDAWALDLARRVFGELPKVWLDAPGVVTSLKRHPALHDAMRERYARLPARSTTLPRLRRLLADAFTDRAFLEGVVDASRGELSRSAVSEAIRHTMLQLADPIERQLASITVAEMKRALDGRAIDEGTPEELAGSIDVEDLPILLFLRAWRAGIDVTQVPHLVVDEAEDFSLFELFVLGKQLTTPPSVTLAGDEAQQTSSCFAGWTRAAAALGTAEPVTCRLEVSYRCPRPVVEIARRILGPLAPARAMRTARDGAPVGLHPFPEEGHAHLFLATALRDLVDREARASIAVLAHSVESARALSELLADVPGARLVSGGAFSFEPGIDITDVDGAKGLEFDYVVVPDATAEAYPATDDARRRLHVAATRTSHQLWIVSGGRPTPILPELG